MRHSQIHNPLQRQWGPINFFHEEPKSTHCISPKHPTYYHFSLSYVCYQNCQSNNRTHKNNLPRLDPGCWSPSIGPSWWWWSSYPHPHSLYPITPSSASSWIGNRCARWGLRGETLRPIHCLCWGYRFRGLSILPHSPIGLMTSHSPQPHYSSVDSVTVSWD